jgi:outer membrane protein
MIRRYAQTVCNYFILMLWLAAIAFGGQTAKQPDVASGRSAREANSVKAVQPPSGNEKQPASERELIRAQTAGNFIIRWAASLSDKRAPSSSTAPTPAPPGALSFNEAVQLALTRNLTILLAHERRHEADGLALESLAGLLPNLYGTATQASTTANLAAQGLTPGAFPLIRSTFIGPFNTFDARFRLVHALFNLSAFRNYQAGRMGINIAATGERLARQQVMAMTALDYLNALRTARAVETAQANLELARTLFKLANDQHDAGIATGLDVTRAETRVAQETVRLAQAQTDAVQARLQLQRVTGLPLGGALQLTDHLAYTPDPMPGAEEAVRIAERQRIELRLAEEQVKLNDYQRRAAEAEQYPSVDFVGDYGVSGVKPNLLDLPTRTVGIRVTVPIFNGGLTRGRIGAATSRERQAQLQLNDLRAQVEQDVRLALQTTATALEQVRAADQAFKLSERELQMARDRFQAGLGDNIEVVNAQTSLANARDAQTAALTSYNAARINFAFAMGWIETFRW